MLFQPALAKLPSVPYLKSSVHICPKSAVPYVWNQQLYISEISSSICMKSAVPYVWHQQFYLSEISSSYVWNQEFHMSKIGSSKSMKLAVRMSEISSSICLKSAVLQCLKSAVPYGWNQQVRISCISEMGRNIQNQQFHMSEISSSLCLK